LIAAASGAAIAGVANTVTLSAGVVVTLIVLALIAATFVAVWHDHTQHGTASRFGQRSSNADAAVASAPASPPRHPA